MALRIVYDMAESHDTSEADTAEREEQEKALDMIYTALRDMELLNCADLRDGAWK